MITQIAIARVLTIRSTWPARLQSMMLLALIIAVGPESLCADLPKVQVSNVRRVFHNGEHNAFTDLVLYQNRYYLAFRSCPDGHMVHPTSSIIIMVSDDLKSWQQVHRFSVKHRDTRDPHFLVFKQELFVYTGTWYSGATTLPREQYDLNKHLGYAAWTTDGKVWNSPVLLDGTYGHYVWKANTFGDKAFLCGRRKTDFAEGPKGEGTAVESLMLESDDGLIWRKRAVFQPSRGDETAFLFEPSGNVLAIGRSGSRPAQILKSRPPYTDWYRNDLDRYIGGPLLVRWGDRIVTDNGPKTSMCWLDEEDLHEFASLPSGGDNSYPGFLELSPTHAAMSWYSSHEKDANGQNITAIYMADLTIGN